MESIAQIRAARARSNSIKNMSTEELCAVLNEKMARVAENSPNHHFDLPYDMALARRTLRELSQRNPEVVCDLGYKSATQIVVLALMDASIQVQRELERSEAGDRLNLIVTTEPFASPEYLTALITLQIKLAESYARFQHLMELNRRTMAPAKKETPEKSQVTQTKKSKTNKCKRAAEGREKPIKATK